ncbi:MAG: D-glycero-alpha-D-manno-heptose-1,7-bisphosphate 7-phosphatase [Clostridia bacterium]
MIRWKKKALFLDRDGVINDNKKHINTPEDLVIYEKAKLGMKAAYGAGYDLFVVTNQGGVELGYLTKEDLDRIHQRMAEELEPYCTIKEIRYCPDFHRKSRCRKPEPGMILDLAEKHGVDLSRSWMVGDMDTDIEAGKRAGCRTAKIGQPHPNAEVNGRNLLEVVEKILELE